MLEFFIINIFFISQQWMEVCPCRCLTTESIFPYPLRTLSNRIGFSDIHHLHQIGTCIADAVNDGQTRAIPENMMPIDCDIGVDGDIGQSGAILESTFLYAPDTRANGYC